MNKFLEAIEAERECTGPTGNSLHNIGYINGLTMAKVIAIKMDVEPVVRCKNCKNFYKQSQAVGEATGNSYCWGYCYHWDYEEGMSPNQVDGDDFCSHGEEIEDE